MRFCGACGAPLPIPVSVPVQPLPNRNDVRIGGLLIPGWFALIALGCVVASCLGVSVLTSPNALKPQTLSTSAPSAVVSATEDPMAYSKITSTARQLTEIKRNEYYKSLIGIPISWQGTVADVTNNGTIHIRIASTLSYDVKLMGVPKSTAATLNLKDPIRFSGTITDISDPFGSGTPIITVQYSNSY